MMNKNIIPHSLLGNMRKKLLFIILMLPLIVMGNPITPKYVSGTIHFLDGHDETYRYVQLPTRIGESLIVSNTDVKQTQSIPAEDIVSLTVWHTDFPEKKATIYHVAFKSIHEPKSKVSHCWGIPIMGSEWGVIFRLSSRYEIDAKTGDFYTVTVKQNGFGDDAMVIQCRDFEYAQWGGIVWESYDRKKGEETLAMVWQSKPEKMAKIFASNPKISQMVAQKKLLAQDLQYILDEMAEFHGLKSHSDEAPATEEQQPLNESTQSTTYTQNGSAGDDE